MLVSTLGAKVALVRMAVFLLQGAKSEEQVGPVSGFLNWSWIALPTGFITDWLLSLVFIITFGGLQQLN